MPTPGSFDDVMARLRRGDDAAAAAVFRRFAGQLIELARHQLDPAIRPKADAEDVVQSAYRSFFNRFRAGEFAFGTWDDLWGLLTVITVRKCRRRVEYFRAQCRDVQREVPLAQGLEVPGVPWEAVDRAPTPLEASVLAETVEEVLRGVDAPDRPIIELTLQGYTAVEISTQLSRAERTVRRVRERLKKRLHRMQAEGGQPP